MEFSWHFGPKLRAGLLNLAKVLTGRTLTLVVGANDSFYHVKARVQDERLRLLADLQACGGESCPASGSGMSCRITTS
jgi:hypothetical protein